MILATPPSAHNVRSRITEQGEVISFRYTLPDIPRRHVEQIVSGGAPDAESLAGAEPIPSSPESDTLSFLTPDERRSIEDLDARLACRFHVERIVRYGSAVRSARDEESDVDLPAASSAPETPSSPSAVTTTPPSTPPRRLTRGRRFGKHSGVRPAFHRELVRTGEVGVELGRLYDRLFEARQEADYLARVSGRGAPDGDGSAPKFHGPA